MLLQALNIREAKLGRLDLYSCFIRSIIAAHYMNYGKMLQVKMQARSVLYIYHQTVAGPFDEGAMRIQ